MKLQDNSIDALKSDKVSTVKKLAITHMDNFSKMDDYKIIDFNMADADQIYFFQRWFTLWYLKADTTDHRRELPVLHYHK